MKFIISLAFKNLTRYKRRTIITAIAIAIGLMMYIIVDSMLMGAEAESMRNLRWYETASIRIMNTDYWNDRLSFPLDEGILHPDKIIEVLQKNGYAATSRIQFFADMILYGEDFGEDGNIPALVTAIDTESDNDVFRFEHTLVKGTFLDPDRHEAVIGSWFAEDIGAELGYHITLLARGKGGFFEAIDVKIVGIVNCPNPNVNRSLLMVPIQLIDDYLAMEKTVTEINIALSDRADINEEIEKVKQLVDPIEKNMTIVGWEELAQDFLAIAEAKRGGTSIILLLVFIIAAVGISNTMLMAIYERIRELGMMRALGMSDSQIRLTFILEAGGIGLIGSIIGVLLGVLANIPMVVYGFNFSFMLRDMDIGYRIQSIMHGSWNPISILVAFLSGFILSMVSAWIPTRRALKMDIPKCLQNR
ncbi:MAG: FtsX-like permease family protein [Sphaerochaetaceae bacterium]|nr:FtsX-like permease family protein [Sphaerochaetaceae bacterium]